MFIEVKNNNLISWANYPFIKNAIKIDEFYNHKFDNNYEIIYGKIKYLLPVEITTTTEEKKID
jgi:hypothetical protein